MALTVLHYIVYVVVTKAVRIGGVMAVVGQFPGIETIVEHALSGGGNPQGTFRIE